MEGLLILLLFPLVWPWIAKRIWHSSINWTEFCIQLFGVVLITTMVWQLGTLNQTADTEVWNGQVLSKDRHHGSYVRSYSCNCYTTCSGSGSTRSCSEHCSTCYEDHYTVTWSADTTVGDIIFDKLDSTSRSVYLRPDPTSYKKCVPHEPASREHSYKNYVKAVPDSLFNDNSNVDTFKGKIPNYPRVYDFYHINRVLQVGSHYTGAKELNTDLNVALKTLGKQKQVNIIVILTSIQDPSYRYAVEREWLGGKKNDVVLFIGLEKTKVSWVDVMTWALNSGNELFQVKLRDSVKELGDISDPGKLSSVVVSNVMKLYDRPQMKSFEYLDSQVYPATWVIILAIILSIGGSVGLTWVFHKYEVDDIVGELALELKYKITGKRPSRRRW